MPRGRPKKTTAPDFRAIETQEPFEAHRMQIEICPVRALPLAEIIHISIDGKTVKTILVSHAPMDIGSRVVGLGKE